MLGRDWPAGQRHGVGAYHDIAVAVYARAKEIEILILRQETDGLIVPKSVLARFRTTELRSFIELASKCLDRGSREITEATLALDAMKSGL